jgi:hypothetical protein
MSAALFFLWTSPWEVRPLLSVERATERIDVTLPNVAHRFRFGRRGNGIDPGELASHERGHDRFSFMIHR